MRGGGVFGASTQNPGGLPTSESEPAVAYSSRQGPLYAMIRADTLPFNMVHPKKPNLKDLAAVFTLEDISGFGPQKFKELHNAGISPGDLLDEPDRLPTKGKRGDKLRYAISAVTPQAKDEATQRAERQLEDADKLSASILTYEDHAYPRSVFDSNNPVPVLYVRGDYTQLDRRAVAIVGSRKIREPYSQATTKCAAALPAAGWAHVSGFALGADTFGHIAAADAGGTTICVMPGGLAAPFPPENRGLWERFLSLETAVFVSEFAFNRRAAALTLRKRNKLIVAFAHGVLVAQSASDGGAMNAFRFAKEQKKPVATFQADGQADTSGNRVIVEDHRLGWATINPHEPLKGFQQWTQTL